MKELYHVLVKLFVKKIISLKKIDAKYFTLERMIFSVKYGRKKSLL